MSIAVPFAPNSELAGIVAQAVALLADKCQAEGVTWSAPDAKGASHLLNCGKPAKGAGVFVHPIKDDYSGITPLCERHEQMYRGMTEFQTEEAKVAKHYKSQQRQTLR